MNTPLEELKGVLDEIERRISSANREAECQRYLAQQLHELRRDVSNRIYGIETASGIKKAAQ